MRDCVEECLIDYLNETFGVECTDVVRIIKVCASMICEDKIRDQGLLEQHWRHVSHIQRRNDVGARYYPR